jgi:predicted HAD superfamily Cof-like phosphohydrolase
MALVAQFHRAAGVPIERSPSCDVPAEVQQLRVDLVREEVDEFADAVERQDITAIADALADILYVTYGAALTFGIDLDAVVLAVHESNMSKIAGDGATVTRADGKVLKGAAYRPPDVQGVLERQLPLPWD